MMETVGNKKNLFYDDDRIIVGSQQELLFDGNIVDSRQVIHYVGKKVDNKQEYSSTLT